MRTVGYRTSFGRRPPDHSRVLARGELADDAGAERFAAEHPEAHLRRREFLARTAALAGAAGMASFVPLEQLVAEAARRGARPLPSPRNMPLDTVVVLMMENRSFDHYFGWHHKADARNAGLTYPDAHGNPVTTHHLPPDYQGCGFRDPDHSWGGGRHQYNRGRMDGFVQGNEEGTGSDEFAAGYYLKGDLGFIPRVAEAYTLFDRYFCSLMAPTFPNRHYQWSAQSGGQTGNYVPRRATGNRWETIFDRAERHGVSVGYYASDLPVSALYGMRAIRWTRRIEQFYADAATGRLPQICFVDPPFGDIGVLGGGASDHPHSDVRLGQAFMSDVVHAFIESPQFRRGAMFINYDEWGGFFEHVRPRFVRDDRESPKLSESFGLTGFRTPTVAIAPYARGPRLSHQFTTHESILKLISYRFGLGHLNKRHRFATNIGRSFDWEGPRFDRPELPDPVAVAFVPCPVQQLEERASPDAASPKQHDMTRLETSGYLDRLGYEVKPPTFENLFRMPDSVGRALRSSEGRVPRH